MHLCYAPFNVKGKEVCGDDDCHDREYRRIRTGHLCRFPCAAMNNCMIIILDAALLLASIFVLLLDLITGKRTAVHRSPICRLF